MVDTLLLGDGSNHALGQACALITAITWGYAVVLFKQSGEHDISPLALNLFKNAVGLVLLIVTLVAMLALQPDSVAMLLRQPGGEVALLVLSGVLGIAIADTLFFYALNLIGVGLISIVDCSYTPFMIFFGWLIAKEHLTVLHYVGAALVIGGVFIATEHTPPAGRTRRQILAGVFLATLAIALMALGIVMVKGILDRFPVKWESTLLIWATAVRLAAGFGALAIFTLLLQALARRRQPAPERAAIWGVFRPRPGWRYALPGAVLGTYFSLVLWVAGIKYTHIGVAAVLNQTSVIWSCIFAALILRERFGARQIGALALAMFGAVTVLVAGPIVEWMRA